MRLVLPVLILAAGGALAWVALRSPQAPEQSVAAGWRENLGEAEPVPPRLDGPAADGFVIRTLAVEGMCCRSCPRGLREKLLAVEGVRRAAASLELGEVQAEVPAGLDPALLVAAIASEKYRATPKP
jgi:hypothetical protein